MKRKRMLNILILKILRLILIYLNNKKVKNSMKIFEFNDTCFLININLHYKH